MDTNYLENNYLTLVGKVTGEKRFSHEIYGERFYVFNLEIPRLSGNSDIIPITVSERLIKEETLQEGHQLLVKGQFRSYNSYENEKKYSYLFKDKNILSKVYQDRCIYTLEVDETFLDSLTNLPDLNITGRVKQLIEDK